MSTDTHISDLVINKLNYDQYKEVIDGNTYNNDELYEIRNISTVFETQNGTISNCILGIPQNIKLTLENNVLTLKAGSILTRSGITYSTITTTEDYSLTILSSWQEGRYVVVNYGSSWFRCCLIQDTCSGEVDTMESMPTHIWFDTENREIKSFQSGASSYTVFPYPICLIDVDSSGVAHFAKDSNGHNMIFNGAGFIGHHAFVYPNVKGLAPNNFNTDGSLKSVVGKTTALQIIEFYASNNTIDLLLAGGTLARRNYKEVQTIDTSWTGVQYVKNENLTYLYSSNGYVVRTETPLIYYTYDGTTVTDFTIRQPVRLMKGVTYRQW